MDQDSRRYLALRAPAATLQGHTECLQSGAQQVAIPDPPAVQNALVPRNALAVPRRMQANRSAHGQAEHAKREKRQEKEGESKSRRERERKKRERGRKREKEREKKGEREKQEWQGSEWTRTPTAI